MFINRDLVDVVLKSTANYEELNSFRLKSISKEIDCFMYEDRTAAVEQINRCVAMLGPGVNRVVRFLDDNGSAYSVRLELVERLRNDGCLTGIRCVSHRLTDELFGFELTAVAAIHLD